MKIWKDIVGYEGIYKISEDGEVQNAKKNKLLKCYSNMYGYTVVGLSKEGTFKHYFVHRLVALAFIPNPLGKKEVNHINGVKQDNNISNLEWCTRSENNKHCWDMGLNRSTEKQKEAMRLTAKKHKSKPVIDLQTGIFYTSLIEACKTTNCVYKNVVYRMSTGRNLRFNYL
jgi:hypothetical protein